MMLLRRAVGSVRTFPRPLSATTVEEFRQHTLPTNQPLLMPRLPSQLPDAEPGTAVGLIAASRWFSRGQPASLLNPEHLSRAGPAMLPYELTTPDDDCQFPPSILKFCHWLGRSVDLVDVLCADALWSALGLDGYPAAQLPDIIRFHAPLQLLLKAQEFNTNAATQHPVSRLYVAQAAIPDLPEHLRRDLPTPKAVLAAGQGDLYGSSIWLGLEPTFTPLHRDPNPNLFCQLCGYKTIRLLPPVDGDALMQHLGFLAVGRGQWPSNARIQTASTMYGPTKAVLRNVVWGGKVDSESSPDDAALLAEGATDRMVEAHLGPGDALFIPLGWWHSVQSSHTDGRVNGSVNWWFR